MPHSYGESDWLLQFDRPLPDEMAQLRNILAVATVASTRTESRLRGELGHAVAVEGSLDQVLAQLRAGSPSISLAPAGESGVYVNPQTLKPGQERIIVGRLLEILAQ